MTSTGAHAAGSATVQSSGTPVGHQWHQQQGLAGGSPLAPESAHLGFPFKGVPMGPSFSDEDSSIPVGTPLTDEDARALLAGTGSPSRPAAYQRYAESAQRFPESALHYSEGALYRGHYAGHVVPGVPVPLGYGSPDTATCGAAAGASHMEYGSPGAPPRRAMARAGVGPARGNQQVPGVLAFARHLHPGIRHSTGNIVFSGGPGETQTFHMSPPWFARDVPLSLGLPKGRPMPPDPAVQILYPVPPTSARAPNAQSRRGPMGPQPATGPATAPTQQVGVPNTAQAHGAAPSPAPATAAGASLRRSRTETSRLAVEGLTAEQAPGPGAGGALLRTYTVALGSSIAGKPTGSTATETATSSAGAGTGASGSVGRGQQEPTRAKAGPLGMAQKPGAGTGTGTGSGAGRERSQEKGKGTPESIPKPHDLCKAESLPASRSREGPRGDEEGSREGNGEGSDTPEGFMKSKSLPSSARTKPSAPQALQGKGKASRGAHASAKGLEETRQAVRTAARGPDQVGQGDRRTCVSALGQDGASASLKASPSARERGVAGHGATERGGREEKSRAGVAGGGELPGPAAGAKVGGAGRATVRRLKSLLVEVPSEPLDDSAPQALGSTSGTPSPESPSQTREGARTPSRLALKSALKSPGEALPSRTAETPKRVRFGNLEVRTLRPTKSKR